MMNQVHGQEKVEYGDFQTPAWLAEQVCQLLYRAGIRPKAILEPTCGRGSLLLAAAMQFPQAKQIWGIDINGVHIHSLASQPFVKELGGKIRLSQGDFFDLDWNKRLTELPDPLLIVGNPPWVTNSGLAALASNNLPVKRNFQNQSGIEAITGSSNFDISEWMLRQMVGWLHGRDGMLAMLCKTAVARKLLHHIWQNQHVPATTIYLINSQETFQVAVDACLFVVDNRSMTDTKICRVYPNLEATAPITEIGFAHKHLIANLPYFHKWRHLRQSGNSPYQWRSGIKHDCAPIMELEPANGKYLNKLGETVQIEGDYLYPLLKSSDIANGGTARPYRYLLVTQKSVGEDTKAIQVTAPQTWAYLQTHREYLDGRKSRIYQNRPRFSIFGVGNYSFSPWKVVISGMYKELNFTAVGPHQGKPVVLDDTCYFLPCHSEAEASLLSQLLNSTIAREFFQSLIFWDNKRPITKKILQQLDLFALANECRLLPNLQSHLFTTQTTADFRQLQLLETKSEYNPK
jgi:predicted RNA methylase